MNLAIPAPNTRLISFGPQAEPSYQEAKTAKPTHEDALIILQLAQLEATLNMSDASNWIWSDEFVTDGGGFMAKYPPGSEGFRNLLMLASHFETMGTLWKNGLLNESLLLDWMAMPLVWNGQIHGINIAKTGVR